jgi:hypothetical protein
LSGYDLINVGLHIDAKRSANFIDSLIEFIVTTVFSAVIFRLATIVTEPAAFLDLIPAPLVYLLLLET